MKVFVAELVCDQVDTRVDQGAVVKKILGVFKELPTDGFKKSLLAAELKKIEDQMGLQRDFFTKQFEVGYWVEVTESTLE
jgi:hypothetical protein